MKILHLTHTDIRYDNRIIKEIEALSMIDEYQVSGVGMSLNEGAAENSLSHINAEIVTLTVWSKKVKYVPRVFRHFLIFIELLIKIIIISNKVKPDIVHCHDTLVLPIGWMIKVFNKNVSIIYDAHELESNKNGQSLLLSKLTLIIEKFCWKKIDLLITVSPSIQIWYNKHLGNKTSVIILNSPVLNEVSSRMPKSEIYPAGYFHKKYSISPDTYIYIYIGALAQGRCIDIMIDVFSDPRVKSHLVFVGFGTLKDKIIQASTETSKIHFHDPVPHDLVVDLVKNADVGMCLIENVSLSDYYSLPNKLFEYSFSGLSVLGSNFPDIKNVIEKYKLGQYCSIEFNSILKTITETEQLPKNPTQIRNLNDLAWEYQAEILRSAYENLIQEKGRN